MAAAKTAFKRGSVWRRTNASERGDLLMKLAALLIRDKAVLSVSEGSLVNQSINKVSIVLFTLNGALLNI